MDPAAFAKLVNEEIIQAAGGVIHHQSYVCNIASIMVQGLSTESWEYDKQKYIGRGQIMLAISNASDKRVESVNGKTNAGWAQADKMACDANVIMEGDAPNQAGVDIRNSERVTEATRASGCIGGGSGQALSSVASRMICVVVDWVFVHEIGIQISLEQKYNTGQPGAVTSTFGIPARCSLGVHFIDKVRSPWVSIRFGTL
jgi:hypothetical protein